MTDIKLTAKQHNKIQRAIKALNDVRAELESKNPDSYVNWYLEDNDNLNLMREHSHTNDGMTNKEAILYCYNLDNAGGGGW